MSKINFTQPILLLLALALLWLGSGWSAAGARSPQAASAALQAASPTVTPTLVPSATRTPTATPTVGPTRTLTPLPEEYLETPDQTTGILFAAVFLLVIIFAGTFFTIRSRR